MKFPDFVLLLWNIGGVPSFYSMNTKKMGMCMIINTVCLCGVLETIIGKFAITYLTFFKGKKI